MKQIVVYPRGFLGYDIGLPVQYETTDIVKIMSSLRYNKPNISRDRTVISNQEINTLYNQVLHGNGSLKSMEFREEILQVALVAFGTKSFFDWCEIQQGSPYFTDLHRRFLNDTFEFITTGRRSMNVNTWAQIIRPRAESNEDRKVSYDYKPFFKLDQSALFRRPFGIAQTVAGWTSHPGGYSDLIGSLNILFCDMEHPNY